MLDLAAVLDALGPNGLGKWREALEPVLPARLSDDAHGDMARWRQVLERLPRCNDPAAILDRPVVAAGPERFPPAERDRVKELLLQLSPWRKGPFLVGDILIDAEWRSNLKWARLADVISPLSNRLVLDVGCGNGYYALRMHGSGARSVFGIEPVLLYVVQHAAIRHFMPPLPVHVLPLRLHELPPAGVFDTVFSMGVLYHQRAPLDHLDQLRQMLKAGGELVLETLILPGGEREAKTPERYARMKNVWQLPTQPLLREWLDDAGFVDARTIDISATTGLEQRRTEWMQFESLAEALDPENSSLTVEGWPAPRRTVVVCRKAP